MLAWFLLCHGYAAEILHMKNILLYILVLSLKVLSFKPTPTQLKIRGCFCLLLFFSTPNTTYTNPT